MFDDLQIYNTRERLLVGTADVLLDAATAVGRLRRRVNAPAAPRSILVLRLERIGDLLMALDALETVRARAPQAAIHLVLGSWNAALAPLVTSVDSWEALDAPWLARGATGAGAATLVRRALSWRARRFDLALNLEPDIRSNILLGLSRARRRVGFRSAGGGSALTDALDYDPRLHTAVNLQRAVDAALPAASHEADHARPHARLRIPDAARQDAARRLGPLAGHPRIVGLHVSGGRPVKQWPPERFAEVGRRLAREHDAAIVLTGAAEDRPVVGRVIELLPDVRLVDAAGTMDLVAFAGLLEHLHVLVTGDTGPMHLAAAVGTPIVALFGPSDPARYGPLSDRAHVLTTALWCRPCNRVRRPPARCSARTPLCLDAIDASTVLDAAVAMLRAGA